MGCDIHLCVEKRDEFGWAHVSQPERNSEWDDDWGVDRFYAFFAELADVRNYSGVAPIARPRGLPDDVSRTVERLSESWGEDAHSHSWLTLRELLEHKWSSEDCADYVAGLLAKLNQVGSPDDVRIVFWFDC